MKVSLNYPDELDSAIMERAKEDGHGNRSAVIRKALTLFLSKKSNKVKFDKDKKSC